MKKSRILSLLLALVMVVTCAANSVTGVFVALTDPTITVSSVEGEPGDEATLNVSSSNNSDICASSLGTDYDLQSTLTSNIDTKPLNENCEGKLSIELPAKANYAIKASANQNLKSAESAVLQGLLAIDDTINLEEYSISSLELKNIVEKLINSTPELFYVGTEVNFSYNKYTGKVIAFAPTYMYAREDIPECRRTCDYYLNKIAESVNPDWSDLEKALYLHDYLAINYDYDEDLQNYDMYSFFTTNIGVCQAYTLTYIALLNKVGVNCDAVISRTMGHTWNIVEIDGNWYHVDVTWDDPVGNNYGSICHDLFLLSDDEMEQREHSDWEIVTVDTQCSSYIYDTAFWIDVTTPFVFAEGYWYFIYPDTESGYYLAKTDFSSVDAFLPLNYEWDVVGADEVYIGYYSGMCLMNNKVVFNSNKMILLYDPVGNELSCLKWLINTPENIYGIALVDGDLMYALQNEPFDDESEIFEFVAPQLGDVNADGNINADDITYLRKYLAGGWNVLINLDAADIDRNGSVAAKDATLLRRSLAN